MAFSLLACCHHQFLTRLNLAARSRLRLRLHLRIGIGIGSCICICAGLRPLG